MTLEIQVLAWDSPHKCPFASVVDVLDSKLQMNAVLLHSGKQTMIIYNEVRKDMGENEHERPSNITLFAIVTCNMLLGGGGGGFFTNVNSKLL